MAASNTGGRTTFTFDTTHHALWAEDVARERAIPAEVVPAPPETRAKCDLALQTLPRTAGALQGSLEEEGIPFRRWEEGDLAPA